MHTWTRLESCLFPPPEIVCWNDGKYTFVPCTTSAKILHWGKNFFAFIALLLLSPLTLVYDWCQPKRGVVHEARAKLSEAKSTWPPAQIGFAISLFQTSGFGTTYSAPALPGRSDWDQHMENPAHVVHPEGFDYNDFFTDIITEPSAYIQMLKNHHVTAHRFSLEWSVLEPEQGRFDAHAIKLYKNFISELQKAGITPVITLSHFTVPKWFYERGEFQKIENIDAYIEFALDAMGWFPEVENWWSFNELGVKAFQQTRQVFPANFPNGSSLPQRVHAAGIATRNMLIAHCILHKEIQEFYPKNCLGVTHQWLQFDMATGNWLEQLFSYFFTKFGFTPVYQFFKEGRYTFAFPFMANIQFEIPKDEFESEGHFLMQLGVQAYPMAMVKMGLNQGQTYPGLPQTIKNFPFFSFGASCEQGGTLMRLGPRFASERMDNILDEAFCLTDNISITEYGCDAVVQKWGTPGFDVDEEAQARYIQALTERIRDYCVRNSREIRGLFCWSDLRRQLEWENGFACKMGVIDPVVNDKRQMIGYKESLASRYLQQAFR